MDAWRNLPDPLVVLLSVAAGALLGWLVARAVERVARGALRRMGFPARTTGGLVLSIGLLVCTWTIALLLRAGDLTILRGHLRASGPWPFTVVWLALIAIDLLWAKVGRERSRAHPSWAAALLLLRRVGKIVVVVIGAAFVLGRMGVPLEGFVFATGAVGAAVAFAARAPLQDLFAFVGLVLDPPFLVGDRVRVVHVRGGPETVGRVQRIGLQSTVIQTKGRSLVSFPNGMLANEMKLENLTSRDRRRLRLSLAVPSGLSGSELERIAESVEMDLTSLAPRDDQRRAKAWYSGASGESRLELEVWLKSRDEETRREAESAALIVASRAIAGVSRNRARPGADEGTDARDGIDDDSHAPQ